MCSFFFFIIYLFIYFLLEGDCFDLNAGPFSSFIKYVAPGLVWFMKSYALVELAVEKIAIILFCFLLIFTKIKNCSVALGDNLDPAVIFV